jgi:hypothetical protein
MDDEKKKALLRLYYANKNSPILALRAYQKENKLSRPPCNSIAVLRLVKKFEISGSVCMRSAGSGRPSVYQEDIINVNTVRKELMANHDYGMCSIRQIAADARVSVKKSTVHKILRGLNLKPYRPQVVQQLFPGDKIARLQFADRAEDTFGNDFSNVFWTDEAIFRLHPHISSLSGSIWCEENPHVYVEKPLHSPQVVVWIGLSATCICKPYFFNGTVNSENYLEMLQSHCLPFLRRKRVMRRVYFQQDGAPPHIGRQVKACLAENFGSHVISRHFDFPWPARSPDLSPLDFWLWGYLKPLVYQSKLKDLDHLRERIEAACKTINTDMLKKVVGSIPYRLDKVRASEGGHFE